jgi:carotenoid cleavage dioxygenase-like enzyme
MAVWYLNNPKITVSASLKEELSHVELDVRGVIPTWLEGTLIRNGPINISVNGQTNAHWFDGLAMLHAFNFKDGRVFYTNKFLNTDAYKSVFDKGSLEYGGFSNLKRPATLFDKVNAYFYGVHPLIPNANINVGKIGKDYVALTETAPPVIFDLETLKTEGNLSFQDSLTHGEYWISAHPHHDNFKKETINYLVEYGPTSYYKIFRIKDGSEKRELIASIPVEKPSYMHSFSLTKNYIILTEYPFVVDPKELQKGDRPFIRNFQWEPQRRTRFIVVNRNNGNIVGQYLYNPFFAFHHANAFEKDGKIYLDIIAYDTPLIFFQEADEFRANLKPAQMKKEEIPSKLVRFTLSPKNGEITSQVLFKDTVDFPRINDFYDGYPYSYLYLIDPRDIDLEREDRPIYKFDTDSKEVTRWEEDFIYPGEPVFVADPNSDEEDAGVILSLVYDSKNHRSFLLVLNAKDMTELSRMAIPHTVPPGLHGEFFSK